MKYIKDLRSGEMLSQVLLCKNKAQLQARNGKPYFDVTLQDKTGALNGKVWEINSAGIEEFEAMDYIFVSGEVTEFQGTLQLKIGRIRKCREGEYNPSDFLPTSQRDLKEMYEELVSIIGGVKNKYLNTLLNSLFVENEKIKKAFTTHSAAKTIHHGFLGGLIEHTLGVTNTCLYFAKAYPFLQKDLLVTSAILHDIGKLEELSPLPTNDYTDEGQLLGHIYMGAARISGEIDKIEGFPEVMKNELLHCILAHHGELEYGSPKKPALAEAMALSFADNMDAKMEQCKELFESTDQTCWLGFQKMLDTNIRKTTKY